MAAKLLGRLKTAVKKIKLILDFNVNRWKIASLIGISTGKKRLSFDGKRGLRVFVEDPDWNPDPRSIRELHRTRSYPAEEDIDKRADAFISNFRKQLQYERQISLQLRSRIRNNEIIRPGYIVEQDYKIGGDGELNIDEANFITTRM